MKAIMRNYTFPLSGPECFTPRTMQQAFGPYTDNNLSPMPNHSDIADLGHEAVIVICVIGIAVISGLASMGVL